MTDRELVLELCKRLNLTKSSSYYVIGKEYQESEHIFNLILMTMVN